MILDTITISVAIKLYIHKSISSGVQLLEQWDSSFTFSEEVVIGLY